MLKRYLAVFLFTSFLYPYLIAQQLSESLNTGSSTTSQHLDLTGPDLLIELNGFSAPIGQNLSWSYCITSAPLGNSFPACGTILPHPNNNIPTGLTVGLNSGFTQLTITKSSALTEGKYTIVVEASVGDQTGQLTINAVIRNPISMYYVLDRSGSMECDPGGNSVTDWPGCIQAIQNDRRWAKLISAIGTSLTRFTSNNTLDNDQIGAIFFDGELVASSVNTLQTVADFRTDISGVMNSAPVGGATLGRNGTSIGDGLSDAIARLDLLSSNRHKVLMLFTDGEQNATALIDHGSRTIQTTPPIDLGALGSIRFYAIGASSVLPGDAQQVLVSISGRDDFLPIMGRGTGDFLTDLGLDAMNDVLSQFSPNYLKFEDKVLRDTNVLEVASNEGIGQIFFDASFEYARAGLYDFFIEKNGNSLPDSIKIERSSGEYFTTLRINLEDYPNFSSAGTWTLKAIKRPPVVVFNQEVVAPPKEEYIRLSATADDVVKLEFAPADQRAKVGGSIRPKFRFLYQGQPVENAVVKARIVKPGADFLDLMARTPSPTLSNDSEAGDCTSQKYHNLQATQPAALQQLYNLQKDEFELVSQGNGNFSGVYNDLDVSGVYKVIITARSTLANGDILERMIGKTVNVQFGKIDINLLNGKEKTVNVSVNPGEDGNNSYFFELEFSPQYSYDNTTRFAGPNYPESFSVSGSGVNFSSVEDNCDGSYRIRISSNTANPNVRISLLDDEFYRGRVRDFDKPYDKYKNHISLHAGITTPNGDLDTLVNPGTFIELDYGYQFSPFFSLELVGGYYGFSNSFNVVGGALFARGSYDNNGLQLSGAIGGGFYKPKGFGTTTAYSVRLSAYRRFGQRVSFGLDGSLFQLTSPNYSYYTLGLGLKYHF